MRLHIACPSLLLLCAAYTASADGFEAIEDFPFLWDIGGAGLGGIDVPALVRLTPRVQLGKIFECPHPCGLLPSMGTDGSVVNGGIPQRANLTLHLETLRSTFDRASSAHHSAAVPLNDSRLIDLDFESWTPLWNYTSDLYKNASKDLVRQENPSWPEERVTLEASRQWETAAMTLLLQTIRFVRQIRPHLKIAFYSYPLREYWNGYNSSAASNLRNANDRMFSLYCEVDAIFPSVYQFYDSTAKPGVRKNNEQYVFSNVAEAVRLAKEVPTRCAGDKHEPPVWAYTWHRYHAVNTPLLSEIDEQMYWKQSYAAGATGIVLWGYEPTVSAATEFKTWWLHNFTRLVNGWHPAFHSASI